MKVKRIVCLMIAVAILLCLGACGQASTKAIEEELFGVWSLYNAMAEGIIDSEYIFEEGVVVCMTEILGFENTSEGVYTIEDDEIKIEYENGIVTGLEYTFEDGELRLFADDVELEKING